MLGNSLLMVSSASVLVEKDVSTQRRRLVRAKANSRKASRRVGFLVPFVGLLLCNQPNKFSCRLKTFK